MGDIVSVCDDELLEFARVERLEGAPAAGFACLAVLGGAEGSRRRGRMRWTPTGAPRSSRQSSSAAPADLLRYLCAFAPIWANEKGL